MPTLTPLRALARRHQLTLHLVAAAENRCLPERVEGQREIDALRWAAGGLTLPS